MQIPVGAPVRAMPLGALELREAARASMARAVAAGSAIWVAIFLLSLGVSPLLFSPSGRVIAPSVTILDFPSLPSAQHVEPLDCPPFLRPRIMAGSLRTRRILHAQEPVHGRADRRHRSRV